jgi:hypothetical protein
MAINPSSPTSSSTVSKPMAAYPAPRPMTLPGHR